jgi:hypothetical protein
VQSSVCHTFSRRPPRVGTNAAHLLAFSRYSQLSVFLLCMGSAIAADGCWRAMYASKQADLGLAAHRTTCSSDNSALFGSAETGSNSGMVSLRHFLGHGVGYGVQE